MIAYKQIFVTTITFCLFRQVHYNIANFIKLPCNDMKKIDQAVEILCEKGCGSVRDDLERLESGEKLPETENLSKEELSKVVEELKSIMAVYGDTCRVSF